MKNADKIFYSIIILLVLYGVYRVIIGFMPDSKPIEHTHIERDTVTVRDTVKVPRVIYVTKLQARIDTVFVNNSSILVARADTTLQKDSSKVSVSYFFPPLNQFEVKFDIKEKIIKELKTISETVTVTIEQPFYKQITFWTTIASIFLFFLVK